MPSAANQGTNSTALSVSRPSRQHGKARGLGPGSRRRGRVPAGRFTKALGGQCQSGGGGAGRALACWSAASRAKRGGPGLGPLARGGEWSKGLSQPSLPSRPQQQQRRLHTPTRDRGMQAWPPPPPPPPPVPRRRRPGLTRWLVTPSEGPEI